MDNLFYFPCAQYRFAATLPPLCRGLVSSSIVLRLFFDSSSFSKRNTIEEQTKNKQPSNEGAHKGRQKGIQMSMYPSLQAPHHTLANNPSQKAKAAMQDDSARPLLSNIFDKNNTFLSTIFDKSRIFAVEKQQKQIWLTKTLSNLLLQKTNNL